MEHRNVDDFLLKDLRVGQKFKRASYKFSEFILESFDGITYKYRSTSDLNSVTKETTNGNLQVTIIR